MALQNLEDWRAVAVHADELDERGDPRAELVRAQLGEQQERARELIKTHWSEWIGPIAPGEVLLRWKNGYVVELALGSGSARCDLPQLMARASLRYLRRLSLSGVRGTSLSGLDELRSLRELVLFSTWPLEGALLMGLESLTLDAERDLTVLKTVMAPALQRLHTRCAAQHEEQLLLTLARSRWWASLKTWTHRVQSQEGLAVLSRMRPLVERGGRGFTALCEPPLLELVSPELKRALPHAQFKLKPVPRKPFDPEDREGPPDVFVLPGRTDFRELPGWVIESNSSTQSAYGTDTKQDGPGVPFEKDRSFHACGWCGSTDTRHISGSHSELYSHFETTTYEGWGYECVECGLFTSMSSARTR